MSLLKDIQDAALDETVPLAALLRKCLVLAAALKNDELAQWVASELKGYAQPITETVPDYRRLHAGAHGSFTDGHTWWRDLPIPAASLPEKSRKFGETVFLAQPVAELQALASTDGKGSLTSPWPPELTHVVREKIFDGMPLVEAWQKITHQQVLGVLDTIRTRVLQFAIAIRQQIPEADSGAVPSGTSATITHLFQTIINGNVGNLAVASSNPIQSAVTVTPGDAPSLVAALKEYGIPDADVARLKKDVLSHEHEPDTSNKALGPRASGWLGKITEKVAAGSIKLVEGVGVELVVKALFAYYGMH